MKTERQRLIKPITIVKVEKFLESVITLIDSGEAFSLQEVAKEHNISNNIATLLKKNNMVKIEKDGIPVFASERFDSNKATAVKLIESDRVYKKENAHKKALKDSTVISGSENAIKIDLQAVRNDSNTNPDHKDDLKLKSLKKPEFQSMLEKAFQSAQTPKQTDIFDGINNTYKERFELVKAIASGLYSALLPVTLENGLYTISKEHVSDLNDTIIYSAVDLHEKLIGYKKPKQENE